MNQDKHYEICHFGILTFLKKNPDFVNSGINDPGLLNCEWGKRGMGEWGKGWGKVLAL